MKKLFALVFALALALSSACAEDLYSTLSNDAQVAYDDEIALFVDSCLTIDELSALENPDDEQAAMLEELNLDYLMAHDCGSFGYTFADLDGNGVPELIIAVSPTGDEYFSKLVLEVCTLDENDDCVPVFTSAERNRYYWLGDDTFANVGSSGADDSIDTTLRYKDGKLEDLGVEADPANYAQFELTPVYPVED